MGSLSGNPLHTSRSWRRSRGLKVKAPDQARERTDDWGKLYEHEGPMEKQLDAGASLVWPDVTLLCLH